MSGYIELTPEQIEARRLAQERRRARSLNEVKADIRREKIERVKLLMRRLASRG